MIGGGRHGASEEVTTQTDRTASDLTGAAAVVDRDAQEAIVRAARLEAELATFLRQRDDERAGCAQVFRDLNAEAAKLGRQVARATTEAIALARRGAVLAAQLRVEQRERRRAVLFIADHDLLDTYGASEGAPELDTAVDVSRSTPVARDAAVDPLAPTLRPEALHTLEGRDSSGDVDDVVDATRR